MIRRAIIAVASIKILSLFFMCVRFLSFYNLSFKYERHSGINVLHQIQMPKDFVKFSSLFLFQIVSLSVPHNEMNAFHLTVKFDDVDLLLFL